MKNIKIILKVCLMFLLALIMILGVFGIFYSMEHSVLSLAILGLLMIFVSADFISRIDI